MSSSSSAAVLTESFDYDLHLENDKPAGFLSRLRFSHIYGIVIFVIVTLYLSYYRHASTCQSAEPPIDDVISAEKEQENLFKIRLKVTEDHNDQISSRINLLNDTLTSLRSRVYEIERKPVMTSSLNFTATKILIDNNIRNLSERLSKQSKALEKLEDIQKITKSDINILKSEIDERDTKYSSYAADITQRLASIHSRLDTVQTKRDQHLFNLSVTSESQLKSRNMILLGKITKIEEKFSSAIETVEAFTNKVLETQNERDADKVNVEYISSHVETVVKKIWNENMEIYKQLIPAPVCPEMIVPPPKIIEVIKYAEAIIPVPPPPLSVDFARDYAGAEVMHEQTSITYSPPEINSKHITTNVLNYLGIDRNSDMGDSFIKSYLVRVVDILAPTSIRLLGTDKYVGRPEDAISSDMSLGSCWPLKVLRDQIKNP